MEGDIFASVDFSDKKLLAALDVLLGLDPKLSQRDKQRPNDEKSGEARQLIEMRVRRMQLQSKQ
jgi:hypothetical protein